MAAAASRLGTRQAAALASARPARAAVYSGGYQDTTKPVLDPTGGAVTKPGVYSEVLNFCTNQVCKGYTDVIFGWRPAYDDGWPVSPVWYRVFRGDTEVVRWLAQSSLGGTVVCQDCGYPGGYSSAFVLTEGMTIRAVDIAGNVSDQAVAVTGLPLCPPVSEIDAGPPDAPGPAMTGDGGCRGGARRASGGLAAAAPARVALSAASQRRDPPPHIALDALDGRVIQTRTEPRTG